MTNITIDDFSKIEIKIGTIIEIERVPDTDKLYKMKVDLGEDEPRQILSAIVPFVSEEDLLGKQCPFVVNLEPRMIRGLESNGMILAVGNGKDFALLHPHKEVTPGTGAK